jgi:hypothetical protein
VSIRKSVLIDFSCLALIRECLGGSMILTSGAVSASGRYTEPTSTVYMIG